MLHVEVKQQCSSMYYLPAILITIRQLVAAPYPCGAPDTYRMVRDCGIHISCCYARLVEKISCPCQWQTTTSARSSIKPKVWRPFHRLLFPVSITTKDISNVIAAISFERRHTHTTVREDDRHVTSFTSTELQYTNWLLGSRIQYGLVNAGVINAILACNCPAVARTDA